jgi:hypothetical protein
MASQLAAIRDTWQVATAGQKETRDGQELFERWNANQDKAKVSLSLWLSD